MSRNYSVITTVLLLVLVLVLTSACAGAAESAAGGFWGGVELGAGNIQRSTTASSTDTTIYMAFKGGYALSERLLLGAELGGYTLGAGDLWDPSKGEGLSQVFLVAQYYLQPMRAGWYVKGGAGYVSYWNNSLGGTDDNGWGALFGLGYDWRTDGLGTLGPLLTFDYGKAQDSDYRAVALALSWFYP
jgi:hypothetical protein